MIRNRTVFPLTAAACLLAAAIVAGVAQAQDGAQDEAQAGAAEDAAPESAAPGHGKAEFIATYDQDGDSEVTRAEFDAKRLEGFTARDGNSDGAISPDEYMAEFVSRLTVTDAEERTRQIDQTESRFHVLDDDEDGAMSPKEFASSGEFMFTSLDDSGDGIVNDKDTVEAY